MTNNYKETYKSNFNKLLKKDARLWNENSQELNQILLKDLVDKLDEELIGLLLTDKATKDKFFIKVKDVLLLKQNELKFFIDENKLDNSYTQYQNKIGLRVGNKLLSELDEVVLNWPFKDCVLEGGMTKEDQKRNEIFFNEVLAKDEIDRLEDPKVFVNWKRYTSKGEEKVNNLKRDGDGTIRENLVIKGNNLLALHSLKEQFTGKVKLIYIDPPYNTGSDSFGYNDNFNHSAWLTFMKNRLEVAKVLLADNGVIFVQCDDNEQAYLKVLLDEVFGSENKIAILYIQTVYAEKTLKQDRVFHDQVEQILLYSKSSKATLIQQHEEYSFNKFCWNVSEQKKPKKVIELGGKRVEIFKAGDFSIVRREPSLNGLKEVWASGTILDINSSGRFFRDHLMNRVKSDGMGTLYKVYGIGDDRNEYRYFTGPKREGATKGKYYQGVPSDRGELDSDETKKVSIENLWLMAADFGNCRNEGGVELKSGKKPEKLLHRIFQMATQKGDIVLDYHLGSGTSVAVAHKLGLQYIGIEQLYYGKNDSIIRLQNVINGDQTGISESVNWQGGGDFIYVELARWNEEAKEKILKVKSLSELEKLFDELYERYFLNYNVKTRKFKEMIIKEKEFIELSLDKQKKLFAEMLDMNQMYVNFSERADKKYSLSKDDIALSEEFYNSEK